MTISQRAAAHQAESRRSGSSAVTAFPHRTLQLRFCGPTPELRGGELPRAPEVRVASCASAAQGTLEDQGFEEGDTIVVVAPRVQLLGSVGSFDKLRSGVDESAVRRSPDAGSKYDH